MNPEHGQIYRSNFDGQSKFFGKKNMWVEIFFKDFGQKEFQVRK